MLFLVQLVLTFTACVALNHAIDAWWRRRGQREPACPTATEMLERQLARTLELVGKQAPHPGAAE